MLSYVQANIVNQPYLGGVLIESNIIDEYKEGIQSMISQYRILKKVSDGSGWSVVFQSNISSWEDLNFQYLDILTVAGKTYSYCIDLMNGDAIIESQAYTDIEFVFEGLFIGNFDKQFVAGTNFKTESVQKNLAVETVTTLHSKYPYSVLYADSNYYTGTSSGLFLELTEDKKRFVPDVYHTHFNKVMDFLCDGSLKILKTHDGRIWMVSINSTPSEIYSDFSGMYSIQFSWTEVDILPTTGLAKLIGTAGVA